MWVLGGRQITLELQGFSMHGDGVGPRSFGYYGT